MRYAREYLPHKLAREMGNLFDRDDTWEGFRDYLLRYARARVQPAASRKNRNLWKLGRERPRGKDVLEFLVRFERAAEKATNASRLDKVHLLREALGDDMLRRACDRSDKIDLTYEDYLAELMKIARKDAAVENSKEAFGRQRHNRKKDVDKDYSSDSEYDSDAENLPRRAGKSLKRQPTTLTVQTSAEPSKTLSIEQQVERL
ncbi:hypothetical protein IWQ60_012641, partial [Tieghemiomyces parasiticus]